MSDDRDVGVLSDKEATGRRAPILLYIRDISGLAGVGRDQLRCAFAKTAATFEMCGEGVGLGAVGMGI